MILYVISGLAGLVAWACSSSEEKQEEQGNKTHSFNDATSRLDREPIFSDVVAAGDFNGDHFVDLVVGTGHDLRRPTMPHLLINDGKAHFSRQEIDFYPFDENLRKFLDYTSAITAVDLNEDLHDDIVMGGINGEIWAFYSTNYWHDDSLRVTPVQLRENREDPDFGQPSRVTALLPWDVDGDSWLDIVAGNGFIVAPFEFDRPFPRDIVLVHRGEHYQDVSTQLPFTAVSGTFARSAVTLLDGSPRSYLLHAAIDGNPDRWDHCRITEDLPDCSQLPNPPYPGEIHRDGMGSAFDIMDNDPFTVRFFSTYILENGLFEYSGGRIENLSHYLMIGDRQKSTSWGVISGDFQNRGRTDFIYADGTPIAPSIMSALAHATLSINLPLTLNYMSWAGDRYAIKSGYGKYFDPENRDSLVSDSDINYGSASWYNLVSLDANNDGCLDVLAVPWRQFAPERYSALKEAFEVQDYRKILAAWSGVAVYATPMTLLLGLCNDDIFHWITVTPPAYKENSACIGCLIVVEAEGKKYIRQVGGQSGTGGSSQLTPVHIGLGIRNRIDQLTVILPDGTPQSYNDIPVNQHTHLNLLDATP